MSIQEIRSELETLPADERKRLVAFLVTLRHRDLADYQASMARKVDDTRPESWVTLEELDERLQS